MNKKLEILLVISRYYPHIASLLEAGAQASLQQAGATVTVLEVPGAFEIPAAIAWAERGGKRYDGYVALGAVIRGETSHYDYVCAESARGLNQLAIAGAAIGYGILTVENEAQALVRADPLQKNKGGAVAQACLEMVNIKRGIFS